MLKINDHDFSFALEALSGFRDKNSAYGIPQYIFWPQEYSNGTWYARPTNLQNLADLWPEHMPKPIQNFLTVAGLCKSYFNKRDVGVY